MSNSPDSRTLLLDAAERLLAREGLAACTTRRVAAEAGLPHGLVHYRFGSVDGLLLELLDREGERLVSRQRAVFDAPTPLVQRWRSAIVLMDEDVTSGHARVWHELQAFARANPAVRQRAAAYRLELRRPIAAALERAAEDAGLETAPASAAAALVVNLWDGLSADRLVGIERDHRELLAWIEALVSTVTSSGAPAGQPPAVAVGST
jgi:AcrR family transcriptional regulator